MFRFARQGVQTEALLACLFLASIGSSCVLIGDPLPPTYSYSIVHTTSKPVCARTSGAPVRSDGHANHRIDHQSNIDVEGSGLLVSIQRAQGETFQGVEIFSLELKFANTQDQTMRIESLDVANRCGEIITPGTKVIRNEKSGAGGANGSKVYEPIYVAGDELVTLSLFLVVPMPRSNEFYLIVNYSEETKSQQTLWILLSKGDRV